MTGLCIVTPTRGRPRELVEQARSLLPMMSDVDHWVIVCDNCDYDAAFRLFPAGYAGQTTRIDLWWNRTYAGSPALPRNVGVQAAPPGLPIVELDDHDRLEPEALESIREAFDSGGIDYIFGNCTGVLQNGQSFPMDQHYRLGAFESHQADPIGVRAISRRLWDRLGGWNVRLKFGGPLDFAMRAERLARQGEATIHHLPVSLTRIVVGEGIAYEKRISRKTELLRNSRGAAAVT